MWIVGLVICASILMAPVVWAGNPTWQVLVGSMDSSRRPAVTRGLQNNVQKIQAYAIDSNGGTVNFNITASNRSFFTASLGGVTQKAPTAIEWTNHRQVLIVGNDNASIYRNISVNEAAFGGWQKVLGPPPGTTICSDPSAASWGTNRIDLYVIGCDGSLRHAWTSNGTWAWDNRGGSGLPFDPGPQVVAPGSGRLDVWVRDAGGILWDNEYASSTFTWRQTTIPSVNDFAAAPQNVTPGGGWLDTTLAVGILTNNNTSWRPNAFAGAMVGVSTQQGWPMQYANPLNMGPFSVVALTKYRDFGSQMYGLVNGRVIRMQFEPEIDSNGHPTTPYWVDAGQELFDSGKVLNGKIAVIKGWNVGQNSVFLFGFEGSSFLSVTDWSSTF